MTVDVLRDLNRLVPHWQDISLPEIEERLARFGVNGDEVPALLDLAADLQVFATDVAHGGESALQWQTLDAFADEDEPGAAALVGDDGDALIPEGGDVMIFGEGGAGKTTLEIDLACHLAAGDAWLGQTVARPLRVGIVENEGPRPHFRAKLRRKRDAWTGSPLGGRLVVLKRPWATLTLAEETHRAALAAAVRDLELDVVMLGPVTRSGMNEAGTLQETRDFMALVADVRRHAGRPVAFVLIHHENKAGQVSGAWEGVTDTVFHVQAQANGSTRLFVQKARWAAAIHRTTLHLLWTDGEGFTIADKPEELDDATVAQQILDVVAANAGTGWTRVEEQTRGVATGRRRAIRDRLLASGALVNIGKQDGAEVALDHVPEKKAARLHVADDPAIAHLRPERGADGAQTAPPAGADSEAPLRRAPRLIRGAGVAAQMTHPLIEPPEQTS